MKKLTLVRHAKSDWSELGKTIAHDHDRPLNARGLKNAPKMGQFFKANKFKPQHIITSTALRAKTTAELIAQELKKPPNIVENNKLYACTCETWLRTIAALDNDLKRVMIVGHNPEISATVSHLTDAHLDMVTCAVVTMEFDVKQWREVVRSKAINWDYFSPKSI